MNPKFRAYHKKEKKMYQVLSLEFKPDGLEVTIGSEDKYIGKYGLDDIVLMQWTGRNDAKGVKVFEGDVVFSRQPHATKHLVVWEEKRCAFYLFSIDGRARYDVGYKMNAGAMKVLGNVFEHPELLKEKP